MRKTVITLLAAALFTALIYFSWRSIYKSTDLSSITINNLSLGEQFTNPENDNDQTGSGLHQPLRIETDEEGKIKKIQTDNDCIDVANNGVAIGNSIESYKEIIGNNYIKKIYDYSQGMNEIVYHDSDNKINLEIVYIKTDKGDKVNWIIMSRI